MSKDPVRLYWWRHNSGNLPNFGDELSRQLVSLMTGRPVVWSPVESADLVAVGSVMEQIFRSPRTEPVPIWGTGFILADSMSEPERVIACAARGLLSAARINGDGAIGDAAILSRYLIGSTGKRYSVGLVPHYCDRGLPVVSCLHDIDPNAIVISPLWSPREVMEAISSCDIVLSSSLHGLIIADSLQVPNAWIEMSDMVAGAGYKFRDYFSCFGIDQPRPHRIAVPRDLHAAIAAAKGDYRRDGLDDLIVDLAAAFPKLG